MLLGYEVPLSLSNQLISQEQIKRETDPLWSIEIKYNNFNICKDFDEELILVTSISVLVRFQQYIFNLYVPH
jgi:hypothetical protein